MESVSRRDFLIQQIEYYRRMIASRNGTAPEHNLMRYLADKYAGELGRLNSF